MPVRARRRARGERYQTGEIKRKILLYIFDCPDSISEPDIRDHLRAKFGIRERGGLTQHLADIADQHFIKKEENVGLENKWYPTKRIEEFRSLWNDAGDLFRFDDAIEDKIGLLSTKQGQQFIQGEIVPAFLSLSHTPIFKTHKLFVRLPSSEFPEYDREKLREISSWACQFCPTLISHLFTPNREILLSTCMILSDKVQIEGLDPILFEGDTALPQMTREYYTRLFTAIKEDWKHIRITREVSKETICVLTMISAIFSFAAANQELAQPIFTSPEFGQLWSLFAKETHKLERRGNFTDDAFKMLFIGSFAKKLFGSD